MAKKSRRYMVTDGKLVLVLELDEEVGGYCVTSPFNPDIITQAETVEEAFEMARDCAALMKAARAKTNRSESKRRPRRVRR
jgi:antitoxin HicB